MRAQGRGRARFRLDLDRLHGSVLIRGYERVVKGRRMFAMWDDLERTQWLAPRALEERQLAALRPLLTHAFETTDLYRSRWTGLSLDPQDLKSLDDLARWPIVTKDELREVKAPGGGRVFAKTTSGSTGEPFTFHYDAESLDRRMAAWFRGYGWAGAPPGVKQFYYWGVSPFAGSLAAQFKTAAHHWLYRRVVSNCLSVKEADAARTLAAYERAACPVVVSFTRPLYEWARALQDQNLRPTPPRALIVGAEKLHDFQRALIEKVFGAPVFETYGCREFMLIGAECERHEGLHLTSEHLIVEIVDDDGRPCLPGEAGRVVVTDLFNRATPFIRYAIGDTAVALAGSCGCGRGLPRLAAVTGRVSEILTTPDGRLVAGELIAVLFKDVAAVARVQVVQDAADLVEVRLQLRCPWPAAERRATLEALARALGERMRLSVREMDFLPETAAGKLQVVVNNWSAGKRALRGPA